MVFLSHQVALVGDLPRRPGGIRTSRLSLGRQPCGPSTPYTFAKLTREHQDHGRELIAAGTRPIDDATYRDRDDRIQELRRRLPAVTLIH